jgi:hypothetical protein
VQAETLNSATNTASKSNMFDDDDDDDNDRSRNVFSQLT